MLNDPSPQRGPSTPTEWIISGVFLLFLLGLFVAEVFDNYTPAKLSALLVFVFWLPLLALHEGGHAIAAHCLGWRVSRVVIGMGKVLGQFRMGMATVEIRCFPIEGFVTSAPITLSRPRLEHAFIYFAGPGIELLLAVCILFAVGPDELFTLSEDYGLIALQSLALAAVVQAVLNLIPFSAQMGDSTIASDGLGILLSFMRPLAYYRRMTRAARREEEEKEPYDPADWWKREE